MLINIGILLFSFAVLFQLITLPVEFDASRRAMVQLREQGILGDQELHYTRKCSYSSSTHVCGKCSSCDSAAASNRFTVWRKKS